MKLLSSALSPYAARVRLAIYARNLPVEIAPSGLWASTGAKSPDYLAINPIGKVPTLVLDDGTAIPESDTIVEYLADAFPDAELRPRKAEDIARARLLARITDLYIVGPGGGLLPQVLSTNRDAARVESGIAAMSEGLGYLSHYLRDEPYAAGPSLTTADCALVPHLFFFPGLVAAVLGSKDLIARHKSVADYQRRIQDDPAVTKLLGEMRTALASSRLKALVE
ncbi:MAG: glutathione S-transferase family protein [Steroidobacteraceae bacterium]